MPELITPIGYEIGANFPSGPRSIIAFGFGVERSVISCFVLESIIRIGEARSMRSRIFTSVCVICSTVGGV